MPQCTESCPGVSVIVPTFNRFPLLQKAVESILAQTWPVFELIIVDDGSTDQTYDYVRSLGSPVVYLRQENQGAAAARNRGIREARYDLLAFLDSDDCFAPRKLAEQVAAMERNPDFPVSHTQEVWYRRGRHLNQKNKHRKEHGFLFERCLELCAVGMSTIMARRQLFDEVGFFDESLPCCEDYDLWLRVSVRHPFLLVDQPLTIKNGGRPDQLSAMHQVGMDRFRIQSIAGLIKRGGLSPDQHRAAVQELVRKCTIYGAGCLKHGREEEGRSVLALAASLAGAPVPE